VKTGRSGGVKSTFCEVCFSLLSIEESAKHSMTSFIVSKAYNTKFFIGNNTTSPNR
jgi:hypothetical protein